jgi:hypothetical protein
MLFAVSADILGLLSCLFAFVKGGQAERIGAAVILANVLAYMVNETQFHIAIANLAVDAVTALTLLAVAVRYASFWQGAVMLLYAAQFALHAFYFVTERQRDVLHAVVNNSIFLAISGCLIIGTAMAWRGRADAARTGFQAAP